MPAVVHTTVQFLIALGCVMLLSGSTPNLSAHGFTPADEYQEQIVPLFNKYCLSCHAGKKPKGDLNLESYKTGSDLSKKVELLEALLNNVRNGDMPPEGKPQPTRAERDKLASWFDSQITAAHLHGKRDPGRVTMRRLNRAEYNNTVRDLLGVDFKPAEDFPADDLGYGFDNIGDVLTLPPLLLERYLNAAELIADRAVRPKVAATNGSTVRTWQGRELLPRNLGEKTGNNARLLANNGTLHISFDFSKTGTYAIRFRAFGHQAGNEAPKLELKLDDKLLKTFDIVPVEKDTDGRKRFEFITKVAAGTHKLSLSYINDFVDEKLAEGKRDRNVVVIGMGVEGPTDPPPKVEVKHPVFVTMPDKTITPREAARKNLTRLTERAFRRLVQPGEVDRLLVLFDKGIKRGDSFENAMKLPLQAILISPHFLFRVELDQSPDAVRELNDFELASRLSYFIWGSLPDEALFEQARKGKLKNPETLASEAQRLLRDPKAQALVENFAGQWLQLRNLKNATPDPKQFPTFDEPLRQAMLKETELFFQEMLQKDHKLSLFLDADFTFVNERLAKHYGIANIKGNDFIKVSLNSTPRRGVLTQASILTLTSNPTRTSPVKRGKWVLETIMGTPPPPPPPDVPELKETGELKGTLRQRMEQHRVDPNCATCHNRMDPIGFGFENFDAVGAWRTKDVNDPVDPGGTLPSGQSFKSPLELVALLKQRDDDFRRCLADKMLTFAIGRGLETADRQYVAELARLTQSKGDTLMGLIQAVVQSEPFRKRRTTRGGS